MLQIVPEDGPWAVNGTTQDGDGHLLQVSPNEVLLVAVGDGE